jgi:hypothetical protein
MRVRKDRSFHLLSGHGLAWSSNAQPHQNNRQKHTVHSAKTLGSKPSIQMHISAHPSRVEDRSLTEAPLFQGLQVARKQQMNDGVGDGLPLELARYGLGCLERPVLP